MTNNHAIIVQGEDRLPRGIRIHKSGKYLVDLCVGGKRKTRTFDTLEEAIVGRAEMSMKATAADRQLIRRNKLAKKHSDSWTLKEAVEKTRQIVWEGTGGEKPAVLNSQCAMDFFGPETDLEDITLDDIDEYVSHLSEQGNSGSTINRKLSALSRVLRTAHERGKVSKVHKMPRRREGEHRIRFLSPEEERAMIKVFESLGYHDQMLAALVLLYTGFRCGEVWRLECRDIDLEMGTLTAWKTKNGKPRTIPIVPTIRHIIEQQMEIANNIGRVFPESSTEWFRNAWGRVRLHMGMDNDPQFVPHMLRHTCATRLAQRGASMAIIKEWMGHSTIQTTARYTHFAPKDLFNAAELLAK